jgi:hypothetical protein
VDEAIIAYRSKNAGTVGGDSFDGDGWRATRLQRFPQKGYAGDFHSIP